LSKTTVPKRIKPVQGSLVPPKKKLPAKPMGRPKEIGTKVAELKEKLLNSADSSKILQKVIDKALTDGDKDQMVALKLCLDRILPVSMFEKAKDSRSAITVNITGLNDVTIDAEADIEADIDDAVIVDNSNEA
jgi:hypothetical protein